MNTIESMRLPERTTTCVQGPTGVAESQTETWKAPQEKTDAVADADAELDAVIVIDGDTELLTDIVGEAASGESLAIKRIALLYPSASHMLFVSGSRYAAVKPLKRADVRGPSANPLVPVALPARKTAVFALTSIMRTAL